MSERESRLPAGEKGTADRLAADDGSYWVRLVSRQALDREGKAMANCVGGGDYDAAAGNETLADDDAIWSLRCGDGVSIATIEVSVLSESEALLMQVRGYRNRLVGRGAAEAVRHVVAAYAAAGLHLRMGASSGLVIAPDGRTYRSDRVPESVWEEIYVASEAEAEAAPAPAPAAIPFEVPRTFVIEAPFSSWMMECNPNGEPIGGIGLLRFEFRATRGCADPVVRIERDGEGPLRYRTRAGVQFELAPAEFSRPGPDGRPVLWDPAFQPAFLQRYREAVGPGGFEARAA